MNSNVLFVISGPSGVGKGTLLGEMVETDENLIYSVSATTRNMREGEAEGVTYYYKTPEEFDDLIAAGDVIEWDTYQGNKYGTLVSCLNKSLEGGKNIALDITVPGAVAIKRVYGAKAVSVFILPPSIEELKGRLVGRKREGMDEIKRRLAFAIKGELSEFSKFDYVVVNDDRELAVEHLFTILNAEIIKAEEESGIKLELSEDEKNVLERAEALKTENHPNILEEMLSISKFADLYN